MRNLHRCHCLQKFSKYEKTTKTYRLDRPPSSSVSRGLKPKMMKPYAQQNLTTEKRVSNYKHSRGRRILDNLFGTLVSRWRTNQTVMNHQPKALESLMLTTLTLHNILMSSSVQSIYCPAGLADTEDVNRELTHSRWSNDTCVQSMLPFECQVKGLTRL